MNLLFHQNLIGLCETQEKAKHISKIERKTNAELYSKNGLQAI
jgi:hypothetical protein